MRRNERRKYLHYDSSAALDRILTISESKVADIQDMAVVAAVFMGMGEPLLNLKAVTRAVQIMNEDIGIGARHITVSTVGVPNAIRMLADTLMQLKLQITLAVSVHAASQEVRQKIIPRQEPLLCVGSVI